MAHNVQASAMTGALSEASPGAHSAPKAQVRAVLFRETLRERSSRWVFGLIYALHPKRIADLPWLLAGCATELANGRTRVPGATSVRARPDGFAGIARDIRPDTILAAARRGFFPWCHIGPLKWWTREKRMVLHTSEFHIPKNLRRLLRKGVYRVSFDTAFDEVMKACAGQRPGRPYVLTWITPQIMWLYSALHERGHAHSFEVWSDDGRLVGGGYGLAIGRVFITESMFSLQNETSKFGFAVLTYHLAKWGFVLNDGKDWSTSLAQKGFRLMPRADYEDLLTQHAHSRGHTQAWSIEAELKDVAAWQPATNPQATPTGTV